MNILSPSALTPTVDKMHLPSPVHPSIDIVTMAINATATATAFPVPDPLNIMGKVGALLIVLMIALGSAGNLMVLVVVWKFPRLKKSYNTFIASLSATDLLFNVLIMPFYADSYLNRGWRFSMGFCHFQAFFGTVLIMCSSFHVALIAINRYFLVVRSSWYPKISRTWVLVFQIALVWILAITSVVPGALGWKALVLYTDQVGRCTYVRSESKESLGIVFVLGFVVPCIIVFVAYTLIWMKSRRSKKRLRSYRISDHHHHHPNHHHHHHWHFPLHDMSLLEWLTSKLDYYHHQHHHHHHHHNHHHRKGFQNHFYHFRHSLPTAMEETNFCDQYPTHPSKVEGHQNIPETIPIVSEHAANDSPMRVTFTCGEENLQADITTSSPETTGSKTRPIVKVKTDFSMRAIKSYVRKRSDGYLVKPINSCPSCPELFDLREAHLILPILVSTPHPNNPLNLMGRKIENFIKNETTLNLSDEPSASLNESESLDLSLATRNPNCFGCLKIKILEEKTEDGGCPCKVRFSIASHNNGISCIETGNNSHTKKKESIEVGPKTNNSPEANNVDTTLNRLKRQISSRNDLLSKSKQALPPGYRVSDLSSEVPTPQIILDKSANFDKRGRRRNSQKKRQSTKIISTIFFAFVFTYLPYTVINLADDKGVLSRNWYMITSLGFWAGSCLNPYIYGAMNGQFRSAYCSILNSMMHFVFGRNRDILKINNK